MLQSLISRTALSGFNAVGNLTYAVAIRLHEELVKLKEENKIRNADIGKLVSLVVFYGSTDRTQSRVECDASNPNLIRVILSFVFRLFDELYLYPMLNNKNLPLLSPGIAPDQLLRNVLPDNLVMITVEAIRCSHKVRSSRRDCRDWGRELMVLL